MDVIFSSAGCITGIFYILVILFSKSKQINSILLLLFILTLCLSLVPVLLNMLFYFPPLWLNTSFGLLWGPLLYFYIVSLLKEKINFNYLIFHLVPFLVFFTLTVFFEYNILPQPPNVELPPNLSNTNSKLIFTIIQNISLLGYSLVALFILDKHNKNIKNHFSYTDARLTIRWSYIIIIFFVSAYLLVAFTMLFTFDLTRIIPIDLHLLLIAIFIYILGYLGIKQQPVYLNMLEKDNVKVEAIGKEKYVKNKLDEDLKNEYLSKLVDYLKREKPYLQPKLSIDDLSEALEIPKHFISQIINNSLNHTFYSLINSYRVEEVKQRIIDDKQGKYTLLAIAFDSGFNSKSGFNKNFKLETGMTPFEFKKTISINKSSA
ncbi:helix-turn-helix domain-containing protein [Lutibacter sp. TH_r2]|uniref:helix-turn-helix domain-containing protein n=1 Tax=Lutibacter sp. TH_r2 TaxID=3082083 RepID=UPI0029540BB7|nr:helix-turn-helix domain-containing protein [Lutibacter sp. TH_r2]MDV7185807.1 helix-turn-helix domain-containing protein [Lutibacter sp. TH_r2]